MKDIKFRVPVVCQTGHKAFWYYSIDKRKIGEIISFGVPQDKKCSCPKWDIGQGYLRSGDDQQFTGLLDKNGNEIYEGDIVQWIGHYGEIKYENGGYLISHQLYEAMGYFPPDFCKEDIRYYSIRIIGNNYENLDLLNA